MRHLENLQVAGAVGDFPIADLHQELPLSSPGLKEVQVQDLHCTLLHAVDLGLDNIEQATVDAVIEDVTRYAQMLAPFTLTFDRPAVGNAAFEISGWPGDTFTQIVETLTQVMEPRCGPFTAAPSRCPRISLAYTSTGARRQRRRPQGRAGGHRGTAFRDHTSGSTASRRAAARRRADRLESHR
ncbi:hypothetical protein K2224_15375 [Streptomyces sp. BHT-5-2]|uniref:hypothetical protein n=1 Tax=Streptomyces sp. BHT-5-2 TaxID=2866715 RepID=UPI001C8DDC49|nr:hypothetical protein [Streptomyces sp. BHT-5-2]QZL04382.1 hypothetical protein K2224_15375 [Streptomyces sp. BHT-5-2]